ncbi:hypothetical protein L0337_20245 [candidate division KSB1 bacterium]|nr:hypothetical protein [candidate division KSB1 bacterium]
MGTERQSPKPFEARLIQLLRWRFEQSNLGVIDHLKVGDLPLEIDVVVTSPEREWIPDFDKFPRLFDYFRKYNIMEVKTEQDRLEIEDLPKLLAYGWLYVARNSIVEFSEVTVTALVHHLTSGIEKALPKMGFKPIVQGIYRRDSDMPAYLISFIDLPDELLPEELQAFSDSVRRQHLFLSCLGNKEKAPIVETIFDLYESEVKKIMLNIREESLRNVLSVVAPERIIAALGEEKIIAALGNEKVITALMQNEQLLKALLAKLDPEQLRKMLEEKSRN